MPLGVYPTKNRGHPTIGMTSVSYFSTRDRLAAVSSPLLSVGAALSRGFSFSALTSFGRVYVFYSDMRQQVPKPMLVYATDGE